MKNKKIAAEKKKTPAKKSITKDIANVSDKTPAKEESDRLKVTVKEEKGVKVCVLGLAREDIPALVKSTGCHIYEAATALVNLGMGTVASSVYKNDKDNIATAINGYLSVLAVLSPKNGFEGMLISQMAIAHNQAMECFRLANQNKESASLFERLQNQGIKLMRLYNQQLETLDKHRNKGQQKMIVEHVHVHKGGQAIVGEVHQGGRGSTNEK